MPFVGRSILGALRVVVAAAAAAAATLNGYLAMLTVAASIHRRSSPSPADNAIHRVAVLIPAHDEAQIIGATIDSIVGQRYPADLCRVHVVADNCTDATAAVARRHGAQVHERHDPDAPGKGPALGWLVDRLQRGGDPPDAAVILDADTTMSPGLLRVVDAALGGEGNAWQAYYTVREPELSESAALRHAALVLRHYVRPLGRTTLGASSGLFGNGMIFRWELLAARRFSAHLTEDVEYQLDLLLDGQCVGFLPEAVVEAEMPATLDAARTQNERWELGRLQLARRYVPDLLMGAVRHGCRHRLARVDAALDQLVPPLSVLVAGTTVTTALATTLRLGPGSRLAQLGSRLAWISLAAVLFHVIGGLRVARVPRAVYRALAGAPRLVVWKVTLWLRVLARPEQVAWTRTPRNPF